MKKEVQIISSNKHTKLHVVMWIPEEKVQGILQISHGMIEYMERYEEFAQYLNYRGILVVGNDHLGHGGSVDSKEEWGYFRPANGKNGAETALADLRRVTQYVKKQYPDVPYFLFGHSMGSFFVRRYLMDYNEEITGVILSGSGRQPATVIYGGYVLLWVQELFYGERHKSKWVNSVFGKANNARIDNPRTKSDWLTTDDKKVDEYEKEERCQFIFSVNGFRALLQTIEYIQKSENKKKLPKDIPMLFVSGEEDPIGEYGKGVKAVCREYRALGLKDVKLRLYKEARHEMINEKHRFDAFADIYKWMKNKMM